MHTTAVKSASDLSVGSILNHAGASAKLVKLPTGKIVAGSTLKTQTDAFSFGLAHPQNGKAAAGTGHAASSASSSSSSAVISALTELPTSGL